jgi:O-antigen/teichoic acid export membrane protein
MTEGRPLRTELAPDARTMARGAAVNVGGALLTTALSFALSLVITHQIRATPFGLYSIALVTVLLGQVPATLGLDIGTVRFVALKASAGDAVGARATFQGALGLVTLFSGALAALLYWQAPWLTESFFHKPAASDLVRIVALSLPALALTRVVIGGLQGLGVMRYSALVNPVRGGLNIALAVPVLLTGHGAKGLAAVFLAVSWATLLVAAVLLGRALPKAFVPAGRSPGLRALLRFSLPQTLTSLLLQTILWTDSVLLGRLRPAAEVAVYAIVQRLLSPAQTVSTATGQMFAPRIAAEDARGDRSTLEVMLKRVTYWNVSLAIPVFALLLLVPEALLGVFGHTYRTGATALTILAAGQLFNAATGPLGQVINMSGRPYLTLVNNAAVAALNIVLCVILIPRYGLTGAACSTTASLTLVNLIKLAQVRALFGINPFRAETGRALVAGLAAAALTAPLALLVDWPGPVAQVFATTAVLLPVYAALFWWSAAGAEERELLRLRLGPAVAAK